MQRRPLLGAAVGGFLAFAAPRLHAQDAPPAQGRLFAYDAQADLALEETGVEKRAGATVHDLRFASAPGAVQKTKAFLVVPEGAGPFAGVLWVHWLGEPATTNRTEFLDEAVALAPRGVVSLLVDAMWAAPEWYEHRNPEEDYAHSIAQVVALRRAMDLLASRPHVDAARLALVGHDYGAMYGMLMAGADPRPKARVYVAATSSLADWAFFAKQPASKADYLCKNAVLELTDALRAARGGSTLFQFGTKDVYVDRASTSVLLAAAAQPKERKLYDTEHAMATPEVRADRDAFLAKELGLSPATAPPK